jgi:hypothetical protein
MISVLSNKIESPKSNLKVVKNNRTKKKITGNKTYYINTLFPGFTYMNGKGEMVTPKKCAILNM